MNGRWHHDPLQSFQDEYGLPTSPTWLQSCYAVILFKQIKLNLHLTVSQCNSITTCDSVEYSKEETWGWSWGYTRSPLRFELVSLTLTLKCRTAFASTVTSAQRTGELRVPSVHEELGRSWPDEVGVVLHSNSASFPMVLPGAHLTQVRCKHANRC